MTLLSARVVVHHPGGVIGQDRPRLGRVEPNTFTGALLDRAEDRRRRDPDWMAAQLEHPRARALVAGSGGVAMEDGHLVLTPLRDATGEAPLLLGIDSEGPLFAVDEDAPPAGEGRPGLVGAGGRRGEPAPKVPGRVGLRDAALRLPQDEGGLAAYAAALLNWHRGHRFCANCGHVTEVGEGGLIRACPACGVEHHPRVDPVVIMLVTDGDRTLLGRQAVWPEGRYSALAGFVTVGESLEEAVRREVEEESGVRIEPPEYVSSQPWPFPASLMLGFEAQYAGGEPNTGDDELQDVRWFSAQEVAEAASVGSDDWESPPDDAPRRLLLPPRSAIARRLIDGWLARRA
jgi:NAD+ diphosphatase